jgi:hypothetical protein
MRQDKSSFIAAILVSARILALSEASQIVKVSTDPADRHGTRDFNPRLGISERSVESALMVTPCQPAKTGYFGGTSGIPVLFEYAFEMESTATANIQQALLMIGESVISEVVSDTFPQLCGTQRSLQEVQEAEGDNEKQEIQNPRSHVTGFKFGSTPQIDLDGKCRNTFFPSRKSSRR